jgi:hypothetical protein
LNGTESRNSSNTLLQFARSNHGRLISLGLGTAAQINVSANPPNAGLARHLSCPWLANIPSVVTMQVPKPNWLVTDLIVEGGYHLITGEAGSMKSMFALHVASQLSIGGFVFGERVQRRPVVYVDLENPAILVKDRYGLLNIRDDSSLTYWGGWVQQPKPPEIGSWMYRDTVKAFHQPILIFDSFVRFHGSNENDAVEMSRISGHLRSLCNDGATVIVIHHQGKPGLENRPGSQYTRSPFRGSSEIAAACDVAFVLTKKGDDLKPEIELQHFKNRFGREIGLVLSFDGSTGEFVRQGTLPSPAQNKQARDKVDEDKIAMALASKKKTGMDVIALIKATGLKEKRLRARLKDGIAGARWKIKQGASNKFIYFPI